MLSDKRLVATRVADGLGGNLLVVGAEEAALARVDHLGRLAREARNLCAAAELHVVPFDADGVSAVLHHLEVVLLGELVDFVDVGHLAAHVRQHQVARVLRDLLLEVLVVHDEAIGRLDVDGRGGRVVDGRGHSGEGEGVGENAVARLDAERLESDEQSRPARVEPDRVLEAVTRENRSQNVVRDLAQVRPIL